MQVYEGQPPILERSLEQRALGAAQTLYSYYASSHSHIILDEVLESQPMTDQEAEQKLHDLAQDLVGRRVTSHIDIARVIRSLGTKMTSSGGASDRINSAALEVEEVIIHNEARLEDSPKAK